MSNKAKSKFYLTLVIFSLVGQIAWVIENMYFNVFIYKMFNASASDISLMVGASAVAATLTTVFMGALSDKVGKRKIFMCAGYILWGISILLFAFIRKDFISSVFAGVANAATVGVSLVIIMDCIMTFFGSTANDACFNAWLTDCTNDGDRGKAEGINSMMPLIAILAVFGGFMGFDLDKANSWSVIYIIIGVAVSLIGVLGFFIIDEPANIKSDELGYFKTIVYGFKPSVIKSNQGLYVSLIAFMVFGISIQIFMPYLIIYYEKTLDIANYVIIMAPAIILASVATAFYGRLYDKFGFKNTVLPSLVCLLLGCFILYLFPQVINVRGVAMKAIVFFGSLFMMTGYLTGMAVFGAKIRERTPESMAGRFQGLRIIGQVLLSGVIGPVIGAAVLKNADKIQGSDGTESFLPNANIFIAAAVVVALLIAGIVLYFALKGKNIAKESKE